MVATNLAQHPLNASRSAIFQFAELVAKRMKFEHGSSINQAISQLGGAVSYMTRPSHGIEIGPDRTFTIFLDPVQAIERERFSAAHSLGRLFLHYPAAVAAGGPGFYTSPQIDASDITGSREASWFAAAFLMPADQFTKYHSEGIFNVARYFRVTPNAVRARAQSLRLTQGAVVQ